MLCTTSISSAVSKAVLPAILSFSTLRFIHSSIRIPVCQPPASLPNSFPCFGPHLHSQLSSSSRTPFLSSSLMSSSSSSSSAESLLKGAKGASFSEVSAALQAGADAKAADSDGNSGLHLVVKNSFRKADTFQIIEALLKAGADINALNKAGLRPIQVALGSGWQDSAALLFLRGAQFDGDIHKNTKISCPDCNRVSNGWKANDYKWNGYKFENAEYNKAS